MAIVSQNFFDTRRTAVGQFTFSNAAASTHSMGVIIPAGAIVTAVRFMAPGAVSTASVSQSFVLRAGSIALIATQNISTLSAQTVVGSVACVVAAGVYIGTSGELNVAQASSAGATCTGTYNVYVDYIYV